MRRHAFCRCSHAISTAWSAVPPAPGARLPHADGGLGRRREHGCGHSAALGQRCRVAQMPAAATTAAASHLGLIEIGNGGSLHPSSPAHWSHEIGPPLPSRSLAKVSTNSRVVHPVAAHAERAISCQLSPFERLIGPHRVMVCHHLDRRAPRQALDHDPPLLLNAPPTRPGNAGDYLDPLERPSHRTARMTTPGRGST